MLKNFEIINDLKFILKKTNKNFVRLFFFLILLSIFISFIEMMGIALLIPIISNLNNLNNLFDNYFIQNLFDLSFLNADFSIEFFIKILIIFFFFRFIVWCLITYYIKKKELQIVQELKIYIFKILLKIPYEIFSKKNDAEIMRNIYQEPNFIVALIDNFIQLAREISLFILILIFLVYSDPYIALLLLIFMSSIAAIYYYSTTTNIKKLGKKRLEFDEDIVDTIQGACAGFVEIKISNLQNFFQQNISKSVKSFNKVDLKFFFFKFLPKPLFEFISIISFLIFLFFFKQNTEIFFIFGICLLRVLPSYTLISSVVSQINFRKASCKEVIANINLEKHFESDDLENFEKINFNNFFELKNFELSYGDNLILKNTNLKIHKNKLHAIIGPSGTGKSSLTNILSGLLKDKNNCIYVDNKKLKTINPWRKKVSFVRQNTFMIDETIKFNITLKKEKLTEFEEILYDKSIDTVGLKKIFQSNQLTGNSYVGKSGNKLSSGQIQRVALARKIFENKDIFILDEAINALDDQSADDVILNLKKMEKTIILITHNNNNLKYCDVIYEIKDKSLNEKKNFN